VVSSLNLIELENKAEILESIKIHVSLLLLDQDIMPTVGMVFNLNGSKSKYYFITMPIIGLKAN
jgi:hypothetical protein